MIGKEYCVKCGNSGVDIDGNPCDCKFNVTSFYETITCLDIPEQYRGVPFSKYLVPKDIHESYGAYLEKLHDDIVAMRLKHKNICICSPVKHSKSIFAYSAIERLFRRGIQTFPVYDVLEIKRIMLDTDLCRKQFYDVENPVHLIEAPYVFIKIPRIPTWEVYDTISVIIDRRVRRSNSTILLYGGTWGQLVHSDKQEVLTSLAGDGTFGTLEVKSWSLNISEQKQLDSETNIG